MAGSMQAQIGGWGGAQYRKIFPWGLASPLPGSRWPVCQKSAPGILLPSGPSLAAPEDPALCCGQCPQSSVFKDSREKPLSPARVEGGPSPPCGEEDKGVGESTCSFYLLSTSALGSAPYTLSPSEVASNSRP